MEIAVLFAISFLGWVLIAPIFGVLAFVRIRKLERELGALRGEAPVPRHSPSLAPAPPARPQPQAMPVAQAIPTPGGAPRTPRRKRARMNWEQLIAGNWMVWAGGLALALGGLFLARVAIDAGLFGPLARTCAAAIFGLGLIVGAFPAGRLAMVREARGSVRFLPHLLAGAGLISLYGAVLAAGALYGFIPPLIALILFAGVSLLGLVLSIRFGPALGAIALAGAYISPLLTGASEGSALYILPYAGSVSLLGLLLIRFRSWRFVSWISLVGTAFWGLAGLGAVETLSQAWLVPAYGLTIAFAALALAADFARAPVILPRKAATLGWLLRQRGESVLVAHFFWVLAGALILIGAFDWPTSQIAVGAVAVFGGGGIFAAWRRDGFGLLALVSSITVLIGLALWPAGLPALWAGAVACGVGFGGLATLAQAGKAVRTPLAIPAALTPVAALAIAFWRGGLEPGFTWGLLALLIACACGLWLDRRKASEGGLDAHPGASAAYAVGLALSAALAPFLVLEDLWLGPALAVAAALVAFVHQRFAIWPVRWGAMLAAAGATLLMLRPGLLSSLQVAGPPVANTLAIATLLCVVALAAGAFLLRGYMRASSTLQGAAILTGFGGLGLVVRHAAGAESLFDGRIGLAEAGGHAIAYLGSAAALAWRGRGQSWIWQAAQILATVIGFCAVGAGLSALEFDPANGVPIFNLLLPAFAIPAVFLAFQGEGLRRQGRSWFGNGFTSLAIALGGVWLSLEVRRGFVGPDLVQNGMSEAELWAHSVAWILYAVALLAWGAWKIRPLARYASLVILLGSVAKVFLIDLGATEGVIRALSFIGLGAALIGVALFYQRFVFNEGSPRAESPV
ncbi:MAG: DUF2339 domain-containing protein [Hyphomonadaceae bacterium]|nr:DUF2339 domain-containing protein [Hyphomonadaceae bacterium]